MYKIVNRRKRVATALADRLGGWLYRLARPRRPVPPPPIRPEQVRRLLLIRTAYLGDVVMTLPLLAPLRRRFPAATLTFLTSRAAAPLLQGHPLVDEVLAFNPAWFYPAAADRYLPLLRRLRARPFDLVIEARADIRELLLLVAPLRAPYKVSYDVGGGGFLLSHVVPYPGLKHKVEYHLDIARFLGCPVPPEPGPLLALPPEEQGQVEALLRRERIEGPFLAVHPGSRLPLKRWAPERYAAVCEALAADTGLPLVLLGGADEQAQTQELAGRLRRPAVSLAGRLTLRELVGVLARARLLLCNDSGPMHLAAAVRTPVVAIFGPSKSVETAPHSPTGRVVERAFACRAGCDESRCTHASFHACMQAVTVEEVLAAARALLSATASGPA